MGTDAALSLVIALLNHASEISALVQQAQAEGRDLNASDWDHILTADELAKANAAAALAKAKSEGR